MRTIHAKYETAGTKTANTWFVIRFSVDTYTPGRVTCALDEYDYEIVPYSTVIHYVARFLEDERPWIDGPTSVCIREDSLIFRLALNMIEELELTLENIQTLKSG